MGDDDSASSRVCGGGSLDPKCASRERVRVGWCPIVRFSDRGVRWWWFCSFGQAERFLDVLVKEGGKEVLQPEEEER